MGFGSRKLASCRKMTILFKNLIFPTRRTQITPGIIANYRGVLLLLNKTLRYYSNSWRWIIRANGRNRKDNNTVMINNNRLVALVVRVFRRKKRRPKKSRKRKKNGSRGMESTRLPERHARVGSVFAMTSYSYI